MDLELEIVREVDQVEDVGPGEAPVPTGVSVVTLRDSHHAVARMVAMGMRPAEISLQTGYRTGRIHGLMRDPSFRELVQFYQNNEGEAHKDFMFQMALVAQDTLNIIHERLLDEPERFSEDQMTDLFKAVTDRAGFAPVQRSINRSVHTSIGYKFSQVEERGRKLKDG